MSTISSYFSDPDITLDGAVAQTLDKSGDGNLTFSDTKLDLTETSVFFLRNSGSGTSTVTISAEDVVDIGVHLPLVVKFMLKT